MEKDMNVESYLKKDYLIELEQYLTAEIERSKLQINSSNYHNGTALSVIVRRYREELKEYLYIVKDDLSDSVQ